VSRLQIVSTRGKLQRINVVVCTYNESVETVKKCIKHLLDAGTPTYAEKVIYVGDDGAKKKFECSNDKRLMVEDFNRRAPHS
jgi:glycosyltransferase involved in cell wall biosynthesis